MSKNNSGQGKIVSKFMDIIDILEAMGTEWKPIDEQLLVANLKARHAAGKTVLDDIGTASAFSQLKTAEREKAYQPLNPLVKRIYAAAKACKMEVTTIEKVKTLKDLIDGTNINQATAKVRREEKKARALLPEGAELPETPKARSVAKQAYEERYDNFKKLITLLTVSENYKTHEAELTTDAMNTLLTAMSAANKVTNDADKALATKRAERDATISGKTDSILSDIKDIKDQLISKEGNSGVTYKKVTAIKLLK